MSNSFNIMQQNVVRLEVTDYEANRVRNGTLLLCRGYAMKKLEECIRERFYKNKVVQKYQDRREVLVNNIVELCILQCITTQNAIEIVYVQDRKYIKNSREELVEYAGVLNVLENKFVEVTGYEITELFKVDGDWLFGILDYIYCFDVIELEVEIKNVYCIDPYGTDDFYYIIEGNFYCCSGGILCDCSETAEKARKCILKIAQSTHILIKKIEIASERILGFSEESNATEEKQIEVLIFTLIDGSTITVGMLPKNKVILTERFEDEVVLYYSRDDKTCYIYNYDRLSKKEILLLTHNLYNGYTVEVKYNEKYDIYEVSLRDSAERILESGVWNRNGYTKNDQNLYVENIYRMKEAELKRLCHHKLVRQYNVLRVENVLYFKKQWISYKEELKYIGDIKAIRKDIKMSNRRMNRK